MIEYVIIRDKQRGTRRSTCEHTGRQTQVYEVVAFWDDGHSEEIDLAADIAITLTR